MQFEGTLKTLVDAFENIKGIEYPQWKPAVLRALLKSLFALVPNVKQGSVAQNNTTNVKIADPGFSPSLVVAWNATTPAFHVWFASLGAGKSVNLYGAGAAVAADAITRGSDDSITLGSAVAAGTETVHYFMIGV